MKAIIPVKKSSKRVLDKNFRPFYQGLSLFDLKVQSLLKTIDASEVYVSSENEEVKQYACQYGLNFMLRDPYYAKNETPMAEVVPHIVNQVPGDDDILWVQVTEPFFDRFDAAIKKWEEIKHEYDSLIVVKPFQGYMLNSVGEPLNFGFGHWHKYSQMLPIWNILIFSFHILPRETVKKCSYFVGAKPFLYQYNAISFDIDSEEDFQQASLIYETIINEKHKHNRQF